MGWLAYYNRGIADAKKGEHDQAISNYNKAIELNAKDVGAYYNRAVTHYYKREYNRAWDDVYKTQSLGLQFPPEFLKALHDASGRER
ncbi:MAG: tetratricopeptide repeat protein [Planctomycetota bacterium]